MSEQSNDCTVTHTPCYTSYMSEYSKCFQLRMTVSTLVLSIVQGNPAENSLGYINQRVS
jgi:hypothetical protein